MAMGAEPEGMTGASMNFSHTMPRHTPQSGSFDMESERQSGIAIAIGLGVVLLAGIVLVVSGLN